VIRLTQNKKVNKDNAFDVQIASLEHLKEYLNQPETFQNKWAHTGEAVGAGAKIYGLRVDNVHTNAYKMMCSLGRNREIPIIEDEPGSPSRPGQGHSGEEAEGGPSTLLQTRKTVRKINYSDTQGEKTLCTEEALDVDKYETAHIIDPLFKQTTQRFDEMGMGSLMGSTLSVNSHLLMQLDSQMDNI